MTFGEFLLGWNAAAGTACLALLIKSRLIQRVERIEKHLDLPPMPANGQQTR